MQTGFFDVDERLQLLEKLGDPLPKLQRSIDGEEFRALLNTLHKKVRKSNAGRKPYDVVLMFKVLVLQHLYSCRVEHVFGAQEAMGGMVVRTIGIARAGVKIGLMNLTYNMKRFTYLQGQQA